jgi:hypothetical protein
VSVVFCNARTFAELVEDIEESGDPLYEIVRDKDGKAIEIHERGATAVEQVLKFGKHALRGERLRSQR